MTSPAASATQTMPDELGLDPPKGPVWDDAINMAAAASPILMLVSRPNLYRLRAYRTPCTSRWLSDRPRRLRPRNPSIAWIALAMNDEPMGSAIEVIRESQAGIAKYRSRPRAITTAKRAYLAVAGKQSPAKTAAHTK